MDPYDTLAQEILYDLWFEYAEALVEKVIAICELSEEKAEVVRQIYLRPNDYRVVIHS
jgi:hypothetical protein